MEVRDAVADLGGSIRPRARRVPDASDMVAAVGGLALCAALLGGFIVGADSYRSAPDGAWLVIAVGFAGAALLSLTAGWWSGRVVYPCQAVPLVFGLVHLTPATLIVASAAPLAVLAWLRFDRPRRALAEAGIWTTETVVAILVFRAFAGPEVNSPSTWTALGVAVAVAFVARNLLAWAVEDSSGSDEVESAAGTSITDLGAVVAGAVVGIAGVGLVAVERWGAAVAAVGTVALVVANIIAARTDRKLHDARRLAAAQEAIVDAIHDCHVVAEAAGSVRRLMHADVAAVVTASGDIQVATERGVRQVEASVLAPLLEVRPPSSSSIVAGQDELPELRAMFDIGERDLHVVFSSGNDTDDTTVLIMREGSLANPFTLADRRLLQRITSTIAKSVDACDQLTRYQRHARFDELTGLPSRFSIEQSIVDAVEAVGSAEGSMAVLLVDLNGFKAVNDTLGHQTGDVVLAEIGRRIGESAQDADAVGRLGGDEFVVVVAAPDHAELESEARRLTDALAASVGERIVHGDLVLDIGISVGMAIYPDHGDTPGELLRAADVAMYAAKDRRITFLPYEGRLDRHRSRRLGLATDLRAALAAEQLEVHFQPKVSFLDGELIGAEALIRWVHPTLRNVPAGEIIDVAEHAGLLRNVTDFVLERAARHVVALREIGCDIPIAVNLTERDIADPELPDRYRAVLDRHGLETGALSLEVTETALLTKEVEALGVLPKMSEMGVALAIDDFGTGFSSLSHLRRFPVDEIKIDMSFVERMVIRPNDAVIVRSIVELGHSLGLRVVAEGVETNEAWRLLEEFGADVAQGNHVMKAIDPDSFLLWAPFWDRHRSARGFMAHQELTTGRPVESVERELSSEGMSDIAGGG